MLNYILSLLYISKKTSRFLKEKLGQNLKNTTQKVKLPRRKLLNIIKEFYRLCQTLLYEHACNIYVLISFLCLFKKKPDGHFFGPYQYFIYLRFYAIYYRRSEINTNERKI
jgi:hypothetical protein